MKLFHKIPLFLAMASLRYFFAKRLIANMESAFPPFFAFFCLLAFSANQPFKIHSSSQYRQSVNSQSVQDYCQISRNFNFIGKEKVFQDYWWSAGPAWVRLLRCNAYNLVNRKNDRLLPSGLSLFGPLRHLDRRHLDIWTGERKDGGSLQT